VTFYVWGGSFTGLPVTAEDARAALVVAILGQEYCLVLGTMRVSRMPRGADPTDAYFTFRDQADFCQQFPDLADHPEMRWEAAQVTDQRR
jgi:hypothetical protein